MAKKKVTEEKLKLIQKRYLCGHTAKDIAFEVGLSEKTVRKYINQYKKNAPAPLLTPVNAEDDCLHIDYTTVLTKKEEQIAKKILAEIALFEDPIEGWSYHLTKHDDRIRQQSLWWNFIIYADSVPDDYLDRLQASHMQIALSPWHDKDVWKHDSPEMFDPTTGEIIPKGARYKAGDRKKTHRHGIAKCDKKMSWREMNAYLQNMLHCPYIQKCISLKNSFDYFLHINDPEKYQGYFKDEIIKMNGFIIEPTKIEQGILLDEIAYNILERKFTSWSEIFRFYHGQPEYIMMVTSKPAAITELLRDNWRLTNPDGRVQKVEIVERPKLKKGKV